LTEFQIGIDHENELLRRSCGSDFVLIDHFDATSLMCLMRFMRRVHALADDLDAAVEVERLGNANADRFRPKLDRDVVVTVTEDARLDGQIVHALADALLAADRASFHRHTRLHADALVDADLRAKRTHERLAFLRDLFDFAAPRAGKDDDVGPLFRISLSDLLDELVTVALERHHEVDNDEIVGHLRLHHVQASHGILGETNVELHLAKDLVENTDGAISVNNENPPTSAIELCDGDLLRTRSVATACLKHVV
jgi:hypothetical protein